MHFQQRADIIYNSLQLAFGKVHHHAFRCDTQRPCRFFQRRVQRVIISGIDWMKGHALRIRCKGMHNRFHFLHDDGKIQPNKLNPLSRQMECLRRIATGQIYTGTVTGIFNQGTHGAVLCFHHQCVAKDHCGTRQILKRFLIFYFQGTDNAFSIRYFRLRHQANRCFCCHEYGIGPCHCAVIRFSVHKRIHLLIYTKQSCQN